MVTGDVINFNYTNSFFNKKFQGKLTVSENHLPLFAAVYQQKVESVF